jgi:Transcription factor WhiB
MTVVAVFAFWFLFSAALWVLFAVTRAVVLYLDARAEARFHQEIETYLREPGPWRRTTLQPRSCHKLRGGTPARGRASARTSRARRGHRGGTGARPGGPPGGISVVSTADCVPGKWRVYVGKQPRGREIVASSPSLDSRCCESATTRYRPRCSDVSWMAHARCAELDPEESDRLFFCGQGQSRLASQARAICASCEVQGGASSSPSATPTRPSSGCGAGPRPASAESYADCLARRAQ